MTTLQQIAVSTKLFRRLESLAQQRGVNVMRVVELVLVVGIETVKGGAEIVIDVGRPASISSQASDALAVTKTPD